MEACPGVRGTSESRSLFSQVQPGARKVQGLVWYLAVLLAAGVIDHLARKFRLPPAPFLLAAGLLMGRAGFEILPASALNKTLPGVELHLALLLGVLGYRLGEGFLRLPLGTVLRRSIPPVALAAFAWLVAAIALPHLLPEPEARKSFLRFFLPQAFVLAGYPLLALRDLRGRPPANVGSLFLVAILLVGAVHSFTPPLLYTENLDPGVVWRGPILVLGESGALGAICGIVFLLFARTLRLPRILSAIVSLFAMVGFAWHYELWLPFAGLGYGIALGRVRESPWRFPDSLANAFFSESPFLLLVALAFAPDLYLDTVLVPSILHAIWLGAIVFAVYRWFPGGKELVTGPGLLFLGLTLSVRLYSRVSPITRSTIDFALPAWILLRLAIDLGRRRKSSLERPSRTVSRQNRQKSE